MSMHYASICLLGLALANPLEECTSKIQKEEKPAQPAPPTAAPATTTAPAVTTKPAATTTPTGNKPAPKPTPGPTPSPSPSPTPSPSPSPTPTPTTPPTGQLAFFAETGTVGGLYPHASEWIAVARANGAQLRKCYANANALNDPWNTKIRIVVQKRGAVSFDLVVRKDSAVVGDATSKSIEDCHRSTLPTFPWPSTNEIDGLDGGPGYLNMYSGMRK